MIGAISCGRRKVWRIERMPSARDRPARWSPAATAHASTGACSAFSSLSLLEVVAGLRDEDVVERRLDQLQRLDRDPGLVEGADHAGRCRRLRSRARPGPCCRPWAAAACRAGRGSPPPRRPSPSASCSSTWGLPISAFSDSGVPSATIWPLSMIPTLVGELVGLLQVLGGEEDGGAVVVQRPHLLPDRLAADRVEAGGRLVEEEDPRFVDERGGEVEPALHAARVGRRRGGRRRAAGRPARAGRRRAGGPRAVGSPVQRRLQADQLAAGHQRVERRFLQGDADRAAHLPAPR